MRKWMTCLLLSVWTITTWAQPTVAFYYGPQPPTNLLHNYNVAVVDPSSNLQPKRYNRPHYAAYAYASIGEINHDQPAYKKLPKQCHFQKNEAWNSTILNLKPAKCRQFVIQQIITPSWHKGYRGFFLDTVNAYQTTKQQASMLQLLQDIHARYPQAKLIINGGFTLLPKVHQFISAIATESLFQSYTPLLKTQRKHHLQQLLTAKRKYHLPIIVIDYAKGKAAKLDANKIEHYGFIPWVTNRNLNRIGASSIAPVKRKILVLYPGQGQLIHSIAFRALAMPIEYLGYIPQFEPLSSQLPSLNYLQRFAGVIVYPNHNFDFGKQSLAGWLAQLAKAHIKFILLGNLGFRPSNKNLKQLSLSVAKYNPSLIAMTKVSFKTANIGFEIPPIANSFDFLPLHCQQCKVQLKLSAGKQYQDTVAFTRWGAYALNPDVLVTLPNKQQRWVLNPFQFIQHALDLSPKPAADTSTENGTRLLIAEIDGDAIISKSEWYPARYAGKVMLDQIFKKYRIPTTVSIIEGETAPYGIYPKDSKAVTQIARDIFALPWVEVASHTYSHPYNWIALYEKPKANYNLPIKNYHFNLHREIVGSCQYIDEVLAPKDKHCKMILWSGDTNPPAKALEIAYKAHLLNMNGGFTSITKDNPSITAISPIGINKGGYYQIFAPIDNENIYTNLWRGPFYGFAHVIQTFKMTYQPRHIKPIDIYYHFYSATKLAALKALTDVYNWALKQNVNPIYASQYAQKALDFYHLSMAKQGSAWLIRTDGYLKELRIPKSMGYPQLTRSSNIIGYQDFAQYRYIHLGPKAISKLYLSKQKPKLPFIKLATGIVRRFKRTKNLLTLAIDHQIPLKLAFGNASNCQLWQGNQRIQPISTGTSQYRLAQQDKHALQLRC